ncbi:MAG: hypothetical protein JXX29_03440 [Deltaproteobacteria bacterium]|nr:hypothetical protein [Deltaproteobacteria bacterium]MBN2670696.1 hypothetical protein [Deltaproteobacteria bacterium]
MAKIIFFEKPGCINNTKQKQLLTLAGHDVIAKDLLTYPWTEESLLTFFRPLQVKEWFNQNAPVVYNGEISPESFDAQGALAAMLADPLLIRRPLMLVDGNPMVGFNLDDLSKQIPFSAPTTPEMTALMSDNLTDCPQKASNTQCD